MRESNSRKAVATACSVATSRLVLGGFPLLAISSWSIAAEQTQDKKLKTELVASFCITNPQFTSSLTLSNHTGKNVSAIVHRNSLPGEEVGRTTLKIPAHRTVTISLDSLYSPGHEFGTVGPVFVSVKKSFRNRIDGELVITSRENSRLRVTQPLQRWGSTSGTSLQARIPASLSVPVLATLNAAPVSQHVSLLCTEEGGQHYESDFNIPANLTFLANACITGRSQSRKYDQLLSGDPGPLRKSSVVDVKSQIPGSLYVWGFSAEAQTGVVGIEFSTK